MFVINCNFIIAADSANQTKCECIVSWTLLFMFAPNIQINVKVAFMQIAKWARMRRERGRWKVNRRRRKKKLPRQTIPSADYVVFYQCKWNRRFVPKYKIIQRTKGWMYFHVVFSFHFFYFFSYFWFNVSMWFDGSFETNVPPKRWQQRQLILSKKKKETFSVAQISIENCVCVCVRLFYFCWSWTNPT